MMANDRYYSEREQGQRPRDVKEIGEDFWKAFVGTVNTYIANNFLAQSFPINCFESPFPVECDTQSLWAVFNAKVPGIRWPRRNKFVIESYVPNTLAILDAEEFFARHVSKPIEFEYHAYGRHYHILSFDRDAGFNEYRESLNRLLRRCRNPYVLNDQGHIERIVPLVLDEIIDTHFRTGDPELNRLLFTAVEKFRDPDLSIRSEGLEKLWDAWERLKTIFKMDKKDSVIELLEKTVSELNLRERINQECLALTKIGNDFMIRHTERSKIKIDRSEHIDYLFHRLFALIWMFLQSLNT